MRLRTLLFPLVGWWLAVQAGYVFADPEWPPLPRMRSNEECKSFSAAEFSQLLMQLQTERTALQAEWRTLLKHAAETSPKENSDAQLDVQLKDLLKRLQEKRLSPSPPREHQLEIKKVEPVAIDAKKPNEKAPAAKEDNPPEPAAGPVDALSQGHTLFRSRRFQDALDSFRLVDLKGRKAEARAPVQYLMAICLLHLGKADEALPLLRDVANSRGDEKLASYAQWQLEMYRWQREVLDRLQDYGQRRLAVSKKL